MKRCWVRTWIVALVGGVWHLCGVALASAQWALPPDVRIESPGQEVPAPAAAFSGV